MSIGFVFYICTLFIKNTYMLEYFLKLGHRNNGVGK